MKKNSFIYIWSVLFLIIIYICTTFIAYKGSLIYLLYFLMSLPFYKHLDKLAIINLLMSLLPDYFTGADVNLWSVYSIFLIIACINVLTVKTIAKKNILPFIMLLIAIALSYINSPFHYVKGLLSLSYNVIFAIVIIFTVKTEDDTLNKYLPVMSILILFFCILAIITGNTGSEAILSISDKINHNSFAKAPAQIATILVAKLFFDKKISKIYFVFCLLSIVVTLLSGSRNAFLALVISILFLLLYKRKYNGYNIGNTIKFILIITFVLVFANLIFSKNGFDISRYNYVELIKSGGTNRVTLSLALIPEIASNYMVFGYGPSHYCSSQIIYPLIHRVYAHTHNTILEVWGELGIVGLVPFVWILISSFIQIKNKTKLNVANIVIFALFIELFVNGIGESMFGGINLWIVIGLCYCNQNILIEK